MENSILYSEAQRFRQWWIWAVLMLINGLSFSGLVYQVFLGNEFGNNPTSDYFLILTCMISVTMSFLLLQLKLETKISKEGISLRFFWFHLSYRQYKWEEIKKAYIREYSPIGEFGGWGIRGFYKNRAFNVSGNIGLQLEFIGGRKLLIGTQKPGEITRILKSLNIYQE